MRRKFEFFIESLCRVIRDEAEPSLQILALSIIRHHAVAQHKALEWARASSSYPDALLKRTFIAVLETKNWNEHLQRELEQWCTFDDVRIVLFEVVRYVQKSFSGCSSECSACIEGGGWSTSGAEDRERCVVAWFYTELLY